jgi:thiamine-phosphate pyrophosphorylase
MSADLRLYALVDPERAGGRDLADLASQLASGGATLVQLRDKLDSTRSMVETARRIRGRLSPLGVPLLVNDRADVAFAAGADGVHLGQDDMAVEDARRLLGPHAVIGLSIKTLDQAANAALAHLDYVCVGGVFATTSKDNPDPPIGIAGLKSILARVRTRDADIPIGAIAGIDAGNAAAVIGAGADGVAVISALSLASDPQAAARDLRAIVEAALARRQAA